MPTGWTAELDKKEHKNWVTVGCALNITKNGITPLIQRRLDTWYQSLISSPPLHSLAPCTCAGHSSKCATCATWKKELRRLHKSRRPKIFWNNSDRQQWGSPVGAWEIAKVFMPTLGKRKTDVIDANTTDISGLLNLLKWSPVIVPPIKQNVLDKVQDKCRNRWTHAPDQELSDTDVKIIFGLLRSLLNESVFSSDKDAQSSSKDLQDLEQTGLVNALSPEIEALRLLRLSLEYDVSSILNDMDEVKEQGLINREEVCELNEQLSKSSNDISDLKENIGVISKTIEDFNWLINERDDLREEFELIKLDLRIILKRFEEEQNATKSRVVCLQKAVSEVKEQVKVLKGDTRRPRFFAPSRQPTFTGRKSDLKWLENNLIAPINSPENVLKSECQTKAVCGLGGCGKTALTVEFAWMNKDYFRGGVFWINGESDDNIRKSVVEMLISLKIQLPKPEDALSTFLSRLADNEFPWLLVVDNTDELTDPVCPEGVKKIFRGAWKRNGNASEKGYILLTTRQNAKETTKFLKQSTADCLNLQCLDEREAASLLEQRTNPEAKSSDPDAINLAKELGCLPLALEQAAAFMSSSPIPCSFQDYLHTYRARKLELLKKHEPTTTFSGEEAEHRLSVRTTWLLNFESVAKKSKAAAKVMHLASYLNPGCIPVEVINPGRPELDDDELRESARSEIDIATILKVLSIYSLFSFDRQSKVLSVHNLVQDVVRDNLSTPEREETLLTAVRVLQFALQEKEENLKKLSNFFAFGKMSEELKKESDVIIGLLSNLRPLKDHMDRELTSSTGTEIPLFIFEGLSLFAFACDLMKNIVLFNELKADLLDFQLKIAGKCGHRIDPDLYLKVMVFSSQSKRNSHAAKAEKLAEEAVQKLVEIENCGHSVGNDTKFSVRQNRASFRSSQKCYEELMELEGLQISEANVADLNISIANAARRVPSPDNFESVLSRYETALKIVKKIYPSDHPELLRVLQLIIGYLYQEHKIKDALPYAEEIMSFVNSLPRESDWFIKGLVSTLKVLSVFDPSRSYARLVDIFGDRWPSLYTLVIQKKEVDASAINEAVGCGGSEEHLLEVIEGLEKCFQVIFRGCSYEEWLTGNHQVNFCKRIVKMKQLVDDKRRERYGNKCPPTEDDMSFQPLDVREFMADFPVVSKDQYHKLESLLPKELKTNDALQHRKRGEELFVKGNYLGALKCYDQFLALSPSKEEIAEAYYRKAVCLAHCDKRCHSLAAAALAKTLASSEYTSIQEVVEKFGCYDTEVVKTREDLLRATKRGTSNLVIVMMKGRYHLTEPLKLQRDTIIVGHGDVRISTAAKGVPLQMNATTFIEGVKLSPPTANMAKLMEDAKKCLKCGELDEAVAYYTEALTQEPTDSAEILALRATAHLKCAKRVKNDANKRDSFLEKALSDSEAAIAADSTCLRGYFNKATSLAKQRRKDEALVASAVYHHLSQGKNIREVTKRYGKIHVFESTRADDLPFIIDSFVCKRSLKKAVVKKDELDSGTAFFYNSEETPHFKICFFEFSTLVAAARMLKDVNNFSSRTLRKCDDPQSAVARKGSSPSRIILIKDGKNFLVSAVVIGKGRLLLKEIEQFLPCPQECRRSVDIGSRESESELDDESFRPTDDKRASLPSSLSHLSQTDKIFYRVERRHPKTVLVLKFIIIFVLIFLIPFSSMQYNRPRRH